MELEMRAGEYERGGELRSGLLKMNCYTPPPGTGGDRASTGVRQACGVFQEIQNSHGFIVA